MATEEGDDCCMPISKRINSLHIRPEQDLNGDIDALENQQHIMNNNNGFVNPHGPCCSSTLGYADSGAVARDSSLSLSQPNSPQWCSPAANGCLPHMPGPSNQGQSQQSPHGQGPLGHPMNNPYDQSSQDTLQQYQDLQQLNAEPYEPELDSSQNPHYYQANELLFNAHLSRVRRQGKLDHS